MNRTVRKNSLLFLAGSGLYPLLEVLWRGYSHASMALAGGVCLPLNIMGQICLPFSLIWFVLTIPASALCKLCCRLSAFPKETKSASVITDP